MRSNPIFSTSNLEPDANQYLWAYHVTIENRGDVPVQLLSRYWRITDARGRVREVRGDGVIGEQPVIEPGCSASNTPAAPARDGVRLYDRQISDARLRPGKDFEAEIPTFALVSPYDRQRPH